MATLKYLREQKGMRLLLLGVYEEGESARYTVNYSVYSDIGSPRVGDALDEDQLYAIKEADCYIRAKKKALSLLAFADNNMKNLSAKLLRAGFSREVADRVCREMVELGYINEEDQLRRIILAEANTKLRGPRRIIPSLASKGYSSSDVSAVMRSLVDSGEIDFSENARLLIEKKLGPDAEDEEKKKLLFKMGFKI